MQSSLNNLKAMKVNFRNRKVHLNLPKDPTLKSTEAKDTINHEPFRKTTSGDASIPRAPSGYIQDRIELDKSRTTYIDSIADTIHLIGQEYVTYLN